MTDLLFEYGLNQSRDHPSIGWRFFSIGNTPRSEYIEIGEAKWSYPLPPDGASAESVYFIREEGTGNIKIGVTNNPSSRLSSMQTGNSNRLTLVHLIPGDTQLEERIHNVCSRYRIHGEWFRPEALDVAKAWLAR